jgi:hypothetical protein
MDNSSLVEFGFVLISLTKGPSTTCNILYNDVIWTSTSLYFMRVFFQKLFTQMAAPKSTSHCNFVRTKD